MKSIAQISRETSIRKGIIYNIVKKEGFVPAMTIGRFSFYDKYQEDDILQILYFSLNLREITLESKMNSEPKETFKQFKQRTYS